jgi:hypothetical protein
MKIFTLPLLLLILSACTHRSISNPELLKQPNTPQVKYAKKDLKVFPLNVDAAQSCYTSSAGVNATRTTCSNKGRLNTITNVFKERGLQAVQAQKGSELSAPNLSVQTDEINWLLERITGLGNIITLGLLPMYHYEDFVVSYKDPTTNVDITEEVTITSTTSWFSLFRTMPEELEGGRAKYKVEKNLIRKVLDDAKVGK